MKYKNLKCCFCTQPIGNEAPYHDEGDYYHTNCHFLMNDIKNMNKHTLRKIAILVQEALHIPGDSTDEINCC